MLQVPELKIDKEFEDLIFNGADCTPLFHPVIVRILRTKEGGLRVNCPSCNRSVNGVIQGERDCSYCHGIGYLWDEKIIDAWVFRSTFLSSKNSSLGIPLDVGDNDFKLAYIATRKNLFLDTGDYAIVPNLLPNGRIQIPITTKETFKVIDSSKRATNQLESEFNIAKLMTTKELWRLRNE